MSSQPTPQDAPLPESGPTPTWAPTPTPTSAPSPAPPAPGLPETSVATPAAAAEIAGSAPEVTYLPAPSGPNWGLVVLGLCFVLVAAGVLANQLVGFQATQLTEVGPSVLVVGGLACAAAGAIGILAHRR